MTNNIWNANPTWHSEFSEYHKLIYTPLDLPEPPTIDWDKFIAWTEKCRELDEEREKKNLKAAGGGVYNPASKTGKAVKDFAEYPWYPAHAIDPSTEEWNAGFDKEFPELVNYIQLFPFKKFKSINFIKQKSGVPAFLHTDPDDWLGFRFYIKNTVKRNILYFRKIKEEYANGNRYQTYEYKESMTTYRDWDKYCQVEKIYPEQSEGSNHAWALTSAWAAHGIDPITQDEDRITCLMLGSQKFNDGTYGYKTNETLDLLKRSSDKYKDRQIWY
jgi:hypothetical protein